MALITWLYIRVYLANQLKVVPLAEGDVTFSQVTRMITLTTILGPWCDTRCTFKTQS